MKCKYCGGPLTRVRMPVGPLNRPRDSRPMWRCLVCGADFVAQETGGQGKGVRLKPVWASIWYKREIVLSF